MSIETWKMIAGAALGAAVVGVFVLLISVMNIERQQRAIALPDVSWARDIDVPVPSTPCPEGGFRVRMYCSNCNGLPTTCAARGVELAGRLWPCPRCKVEAAQVIASRDVETVAATE